MWEKKLCGILRKGRVMVVGENGRRKGCLRIEANEQRNLESV